MCLQFSKMSNIEHRPVIKFFTRKRFNAFEISKDLNNVYNDSTALYCTVTNWLAEFNNPEHGFEDAPRMSRPSTITTQENIEQVQRIGMDGRQISIRRLAEELPIIHEIMKNHMGVKKVCTQWVNEIVDTNSTCQSCGLLSRAPATQRSKSCHVFSLHHSRR